MIAFAYYGAKNTHLQHILPLLPECSHYCEPFAGSAAVLLNREPSPIETLNDLNGDIVNFFRVLRDNSQALIDALMLTPYSREEFILAWEPCEDPVERARRWYVRVQMDVAKAGARKDRSWSTNVSFSPGAHSYCVRNFMQKIPGMYDIVQRLRTVQIDNRPAVDCIKKYGRVGTLIYLDPPYVPECRTSSNDYKFEMSIEDHWELSVVAKSTPAMVAISGYDSELYDHLYKDWHKTVFPKKAVPMSRGKGRVTQECLWTNYDPHKPKGQLKIYSMAIKTPV